MPAQDTSPKAVRFGVFELDLQRAELRKQGVKVKLQEQPLKVLQLLLENPGQIVSREQVRTHIWTANTFVEFDQGLYSAMARLRQFHQRSGIRWHATIRAFCAVTAITVSGSRVRRRNSSDSAHDGTTDECAPDSRNHSGSLSKDQRRSGIR